MEAEDTTTTPTDRRDGMPGDGPHPATDAHEPVQETLPFPVDGPIPFALTARARRVVAPGSLPSLRVLGRPEADGSAGPAPQTTRLHDAAPVDLDDPHDTRPSRARALRRAGVEVARIATELDVDELVVRAWVDEVGPVHSARRRLRAVAEAPTGNAGEHRTRQIVEHRRAAERFDAAREAARAEVGPRLTEPGFVTGLGLVAGLLEFGHHAAVLTVRRRDLAGAAVRWLLESGGVAPSRVRVLLRIAPQVAGDLAAHDWATSLGLPPGQVSFTRWRAAPDAEAEEAMIRIADPAAAARLAGWRDALLGAVSGDATAPDPTF